MKTLYTIAFALTAALLFNTASFAQTAVTSGFKVDESVAIYNKQTGERISEEAFAAIVKSNPRVHLQTEFDERGNVSAIFYDPNGSGFVKRDASERPKPGQPFPKFIFQTTSGETLESDKLSGRVVVLYFNMAFAEPFTTPQSLTDFEEALKASAGRNDIVPIILTHSAAEKVFAFTEKVKVPYATVASARNFFEKYIILKMPSFIVIKKDGMLAAYADDLAELKKALQHLD